MKSPFSIIAAAAFLVTPLYANDADRAAGAEIYKNLCADCHGDKGQGVATKHDEPLYGERSVASLTKLIDRTMPEDEPEKCSAEESRKVALYIYDAFYSPMARAKLNPPKRDFVRLTNRQFRESVADLIGSFEKVLPPGEGRGLAGKYYDSDGMEKKSKKRMERTDQAIDFDFGEVSPMDDPYVGQEPGEAEILRAQAKRDAPERMKEDQFSVEWQGSLLAPETGVYEFRIKTRNGVRLYLNTDLADGDGNRRDDSDAKRVNATIDGWVTTGPDIREETASVFLLGGRAYPLNLDYFKYKEKVGYVRFEWKPPHGVWEVVAAPFLSPSPAAPTAVVATNFPPDDSSVGYERGTSVSKDWHEATTKAALEIADQVVARLPRFVGEKADAPDRVEKLKEFIATLAERAFRRPLDDAQRQLYVERSFDGVAPEVAVKRAVLLILKSPRFLYPELEQKADDFTVASRLAMALWDSLPDAALRVAAARGDLHTPEQIHEHAERMVPDPRTKAKVGDFFHHWLAMQEADDLSKDAVTYPGFSQEIVADLRRSLEYFVRDVMWSEASDYRQLVLSDSIMMNARLARYYGVPAPDGGGFAAVKFDPVQRAGVITHPFLLSTFSYHKSSSPIHRGVFLTRNVLGRLLKPPPQAIEFKDDRFDPTLTMREKVTQLTNKTACMSCHVTINPLGFALENFDAVGRFRTTDANKPIDPASDYITSDGDTVKLTGPRDLAKHVAESEDARRGFVKQMFHYMVKQPTLSYGGDTLERLDAQFLATNANMRKLLTEIATTAAVTTETPNTASR